MILVVGGTGRLGTLLVARLTGRGLAVRVMTRNGSRIPPGGLVEVVPGDVRDREAVARAAEGVSVVVSAMHGFPGNRQQNPASIDRDGNINLAEASRASGADLVLMSVVGASAGHPMELFRMKHAAETQAREMGLPLTIIRASAYLELWLEILQNTARATGRPIVFGPGNNPINFVSVVDVAEIVDLAVMDASVRGRTLEVTGPDTLTLNELAAALQRSAGRIAAPMHVPSAVLQVAANTLGRVLPAVRRQTLAALLMNELDLTADQSVLPENYPRPATNLGACLNRLRDQPTRPRISRPRAVSEVARPNRRADGHFAWPLRAGRR